MKYEAYERVWLEPFAESPTTGEPSAWYMHVHPADEPCQFPSGLLPVAAVPGQLFVSTFPVQGTLPNIQLHSLLVRETPTTNKSRY